jgi:hypothetical protein
MPTPPSTDSTPDRSAIPGSTHDGTSDGTTTPPAAPGVLTTLLCERCGNVNLIRVKGCWYCEACHHKFDCYGW